MSHLQGKTSSLGSDQELPLRSNHQYDSLIVGFLIKEQESEKKKYFNNLVGEGPKPNHDNIKLENPLEEIFLKNMKTSLLEF